MDKKTIGLLLGVAGIILWFMPLVYVDMGNFMEDIFQGIEMYQAGHHIGGIAYLLIMSSAAYAYSSWVINRQFAIITSAVATGISILFLLQAGSSVAWGLLCLVVISIVSLITATRMVETTETPEA